MAHRGGAGNQPNNPPTSQPKPPTETPTPQPPVTGPDNGVDTPEEIPIFVQKQLDQTQSLVINNATWSRITNFNAKRNLEKDVYVTSITRKYHDGFRYPAWNWNWEKNSEGSFGLHDKLLNYEKSAEVGYEWVDRAVFGADLVWNERTDFQVGTDKKTGKPIFAKYNDPRFILNEIEKGTLKQHPAASVWFKQQISDQTKAITKEFSIGANALGSTATGLYAAPGEIITLKFKNETLNEMIKQNVNNFQVIINENYWDNKAAGDPKESGSISTRYPFVQTAFTINVATLQKNNGEFKFGSPFGGAISIKTNSKMLQATNSIFSQSYLKYNFEISGALEMLTYTDNVTTKADWDAQLERIRTGQINAPAMAIDLPLLSMNIPATDINQFSGVNYDQIVFPEAVAKKWNSFMFLSEFFASRDKSGKLVKLMLRFCDDIWGGAAAWGGGDSTSLPIAWAARGFLNGMDSWNSFAHNWGLFHEINHNFQQNGALFSKRSHGETDQASMYILSMLSDHGRFRNLYNPFVELDNGQWGFSGKRMSSGWNTIEYINKVKNGKGGSEFELPTLLAFQFGSFNMMQYIRNDAYNAPNSNGIDEVIQLSKAFKVNLWPAVKEFSKFWTWEDLTKGPNSNQQAQLNEISNKYPAVNFVGNVFATGSYIYSQEKNQFIYTNDTSAPLTVAMNAPYVFDFEQGINSFMNTIQWDELSFNPTTKLGGKLAVDPTNKKRLIYEPPKDVYNQIDEFDIAIKPTNQADIFVKEYRWKIKLNIASNLPLVTIYNKSTTDHTGGKGKDFYQEQKYMDDISNYAFQAPIDVRSSFYADQSQTDKTWQRAKVSFNFVAPEAGQYDFKIKGDSWFFIDVDDQHKNNSEQPWWSATEVPSSKFISTNHLMLKKGEVVRFDVYLTYRRGNYTFNMLADVNGNSYDLFDHVTSPFAKASEDLLGFKYLPRAIDQDLLNQNLVSGVDSQKFDFIAKDEYQFEVPGDNRHEQINQWLAESDKSVWEVWRQNEPKPFTKDLIVNFKNPQTIASLAINHRNDNHWEARATKMTIKDQNGLILYQDDHFGSQFNDRNKPTSIVNFDKPATNVTKLTITMTNERYDAFSINTIKFSKNSYHHLNRIIAANDPVIKYYGDDWNLEANNVDTNISAFSPTYSTTNGKYQYFETTINATGFDLIGQKGLELGRFDLYVNDQLIGTYDSSNANRLDNQILASYRADDWATSQSLKIKIVNHEDKPLRFDGLQLYGRNVSLVN